MKTASISTNVSGSKTQDPDWYMEWYFNFDVRRGLTLHSYGLPGYPASHACLRLLERDAIWIYEWGEGWTINTTGIIVTQGTSLVIAGDYAFGASPPWRSFEYLARGITLPETPLLQDVGKGIVPQPIRSCGSVADAGRSRG